MINVAQIVNNHAVNIINTIIDYKYPLYSSAKKKHKIQNAYNFYGLFLLWKNAFNYAFLRPPERR